MEEKWTLVETVDVMGQGYDLYENEDHTLCKQVWFDGYEEIYEQA